MTSPSTNGTGPREGKTTYKTTGNNNVPGSPTKQPKNSAAYDNTVAPYNHDGNDVSGYVGVDSYYRTYGDVRNKPLGSTSNGYALSNPEMEGLVLGGEDDSFLPQLVADSGVEMVGPVQAMVAEAGSTDAEAASPDIHEVVARLTQEQRDELRAALEQDDSKTADDDKADAEAAKSKAEAEAKSKATAEAKSKAAKSDARKSAPSPVQPPQV